MSPVPLAHRACLLFVPGNRQDRFDKACRASPEGIVLDLEDAVPPAQKDAARSAVVDYLTGRDGGPSLFVRLNAPGSRAGLNDLAALADGRLPCEGIVLPKVESPRDIQLIRQLDGQAHRSIVVAVETATGIERSATIASSLRDGDGLAFGGADLAADLGAAFAWEPLLAARSTLVRAAATARLPAFDVPHLAIDAPSALADEARRARDLGFTGKLAIHPAQVTPIRAAFGPTSAEVERARRVVAAMEAACGGIAILDGRMIDAPVAAAARRALARASAAA